MSTPLNEKECIIAMYDSYAKTVMRNQCRNAVKSKRRRQSHEIAGTEKIQYLFETQSHTDIYPSEHLVVYGGTYTCVVTSEKLYHAMSLLPEGQRAVLMGMSLQGGFSAVTAEALIQSIHTISSESTLPVSQQNDNSITEENTVEKMTLQIGNNTFTATLENNDAVDTLVDMMREAPVVIQMSDYSGFEKVGSLGTNLPTNNKQTTTQSGDIVLYTGNQIVIFYGSNSWSYTRLGRIDDLSGWEDALGSGDFTVTFSLE